MGGLLTRRLFTVTAGLGWPLAALLAAQVPRPAPEFVIKLTSGQQLLLSQYRGKVVALEFLSTTCPHCQTCSALLDRLYKEYGPRGFQPLGVAFNEMAGMLVPDYSKHLGLTFPVGVSERDPVLNFLQHSAVMRLLVPQLIFIDRQGIIRGQHGGDDDFFKDEEKNMRARIEGLLKEPAAARKTTPASRVKKAASAGPASLPAPQGIQ
jgi:peroxiredoxin